MNVQDQLESDHIDLDRLLGNIFAALDRADCAEVYRSLDLFWARLAMHIRAEHQRLFPAVLHMGDTLPHYPGPGEVPAEVAVIIDSLHADHDFFMRSLARAIKAMRLVFDFGNEAETLSTVRGIIEEVRSRLVTHNLIEEQQIYPLAAVPFFRTGELEELSREVKKELENFPRRFDPQKGAVRQ